MQSVIVYVIGVYKTIAARAEDTSTSGISWSIRSEKSVLISCNMIRGVVIFALLGVAFASPSANQYLQNVIQTSLPNEIMRQGLNPARLPAFSVRFGNQGIYGPQYEADFRNGTARGFNQVRTRTDCQGPRTYGGQITINCTLALTQLITEYNVRILNGSHVFNFRNMGHVQETLVDVSIVGFPQNYLGTLRRFQIVRMGLITPTFGGMPRPFIKYVKVLEDAYKANVSTSLVNLLQQNFVQALGRALAQKPMPRQ